MTFVQLQDDVMERLGLTAPESRTRIKRFLNQRYRRLATALSLGKVRRSEVSFVTVDGTKTYTPTTLIKPYTITYPAGNVVLEELTLDQIRHLDPNDDREGAPEAYAVTKYGATTVTIKLHPTPDAAYTLTVDGLITGTDMSADADTPAFPEDFHDALIFGAEADELAKMEKYELSKTKEQAFESRLRELRYFIAKSAYLSNQPGSSPYRMPYEPRWTE